MLVELKVDNLALIESLHLRFDQENRSGLVVMTGETGAGKSIMLRAIQLLSGGRGSADWIRNGADSCVVEALFECGLQDKDFLHRLDEAGFGTEPTVLIKRIINSKGRSRLYVNGSLATAKIVGGLTEYLFNVAGQHDQQKLLQPTLHLDFLDTIGDLWSRRLQVGELFGRYEERKKELSLLKEQEREKEQRRDFLSYQLDEIRQAAPEPGEDEALEKERRRLKSAESLIQLSRRCYGQLSSTIVDGLAQIRKDMETVAELDADAEGLAAEVAEYSFQAEDLVASLRNYRDSLENNPARLETINERMAELQQLKRKYGDSLAMVIEFGEQAEAELQRLDNMDEELSRLQQEVDSLLTELTEQAAGLSEARQQVAMRLETAMEAELESLAFDRSSLAVQFNGFNGNEEIRATGRDRVEFFFSANPGEPPRPLAKVASGGELSRLMLAFKCLLARKDMVETVIFDEVDAGIGGEAAEAVARKIQELSSHHQVFCITHLPQIAARGNEHFRVTKTEAGGRTHSSINLLSDEDRVEELSRMLAGESPSSQTRAWAEELLSKGN
ncbi:MAG: DNA repair protein RecN [Thermodesulfobacteriota bacterium]